MIAIMNYNKLLPARDDEIPIKGMNTNLREMINSTTACRVIQTNV